MAPAQENVYTLDDIYALPEGQRAELIDGQIYNMAPPTRIHQHLLMNLSALIHHHIQKKKRTCAYSASQSRSSFSTQAQSLLLLSLAMRTTSSWVCFSLAIPVAMLVMQAIPSTFIPR